MGALLDEFAFGKDEDFIGVADGGEAVGDDEGGAAGHEALEGFVDEALGLAVEGGGGFVEEEDFGIGEDGPGDGDALALAAGEFGAAGADEGLVAFREVGDEFVGVGLGGGGFDFLCGGAGFAVGDVFVDGAAEEHDFLGDDGDLAAEAFQGDFLGIGGVEEELAGGGVIEAEDEGEKGGFPGTGRADDGGALAGGEGGGDFLEDGDFGAGGVGERGTGGRSGR